MDTPFLDSVAEGLAARGVRVLRFEFPYMARRRADGRRRGPDRMPVLLDAYRAALAAAGEAERLVVGGKSMGGRVAATLAAAEGPALGIAGVVCLGYPFHPPKQPETLRLAPLRDAQTPVLVVQGERDPFGSREEVAGYSLPDRVRLAWIGDGDHSLAPRKRSGFTEAGNRTAAVEAVAGFLAGLA